MNVSAGLAQISVSMEECHPQIERQSGSHGDGVAGAGRSADPKCAGCGLG